MATRYQPITFYFLRLHSWQDGAGRSRFLGFASTPSFDEEGIMETMDPKSQSGCQ